MIFIRDINRNFDWYCFAYYADSHLCINCLSTRRGKVRNHVLLRWRLHVRFLSLSQIGDVYAEFLRLQRLVQTSFQNDWSSALYYIIAQSNGNWSLTSTMLFTEEIDRYIG